MKLPDLPTGYKWHIGTPESRDGVDLVEIQIYDQYAAVSWPRLDPCVRRSCVDLSQVSSQNGLRGAIYNAALELANELHRTDTLATWVKEIANEVD